MSLLRMAVGALLVLMGIGINASELAIVQCDDDRSKACIEIYQPVCASVLTGIVCITEPCPSSIEKTYSNGCKACSDKDVLAYKEGACTKASEDK